MPRPKHEHDVYNVTHAPRYAHDCSRCKFSWNCGPSCVCEIELQIKHGTLNLPEAPLSVKLWANKFTHDDWRDDPNAKYGYGLPYPELEDEK